MKLRNFFEKKRNIFLVSFLGAYLVTFAAFMIINFVMEPPSLKIADTGHEVDETLTIKEKKIYDDNDVIIRQIDFTSSSVTGSELNLEITNNSKTTYYVRDRRMAVNRVMTKATSLGMTELLPDTKTIVKIPISVKESKLVDIDKICEVALDLEFCLDEGSVFVPPTIEFVVDDLVFQTNHYKDLPKLKDIDGKLIYDRDNVLVTVNEETLFKDNKAQVSIQNNNDQDVVFTVVNFTVDGNKIKGSYEVVVRANSRTITSELSLSSVQEDLSQDNHTVEAIAGVYDDAGEALLSQPYKVSWK